MPFVRPTLLLLVVLTAPGLRLAAADAPEPPATRFQIDTWIRELGHPNFRVREAAAGELTRRAEARAAVRVAAAAAADPEVRSRARAILHAYYRIDRPKVLARMKALAGRREADLLAETAVRYLGDEDPVWQVLTDFGWDGMDVARDSFGRMADAPSSYLPDREFAKFKENREPEVLFPQAGFANSGTVLFRGVRLALDRRATAPLVAASGPVDARGAYGCFWLANGDVTLTGSVTGSVIVSDGDIEARAAGRPRWSYLRSTLLVARGDIRIPLRVTDCVILAAGNVDIPDGATLRSTTIRAGGKILRPEDWYEEDVAMVEDRRANPTRPFVFFEPSRVGAEVAAAAGGVRVTKVRDGSPLVAAGVRVGDVVTEVDGQGTATPAAFRRRLRSAVVAGEGTLAVRRGGETVELVVHFAE